MRYFDYESVGREAKIPEEKLRKLVNLVRREFPHDPMMAELHTCVRAWPSGTAISI
jgi:hypothetical protein